MILFNWLSFSQMYLVTAQWTRNGRCQVAMGQNPIPPVNIPIPTKIPTKMRGDPLVLTHTQVPVAGRLTFLPSDPRIARQATDLR